jgi:hypothetical protein
MEAETIAAILVPTLLLAIPIVAILTHHQRKMAELIHARRGDSNNEVLQGRIAQLEHEVHEMRDRLNATAIERDRPRAPIVPDDHINA